MDASIGIGRAECSPIPQCREQYDEKCILAVVIVKVIYDVLAQSCNVPFSSFINRETGSV